MFNTNDMDLSNGRCKACDKPFGDRDIDEDMCGTCRAVSMQAAHGHVPNELNFMRADSDEEAYAMIMESYEEHMKEIANMEQQLYGDNYE